MTDLTFLQITELREAAHHILADIQNHAGDDVHDELGRRLYAAFGDVPSNHWPEIFGRGGIKGASYLATAYSGARLKKLSHR